MAAATPHSILFAILSFLLLCQAIPVPALLSDVISTPSLDSTAKGISLLPAAVIGGGYVETWTASPEGAQLNQGAVVFQDTTIRQTVPLSVGGSQFTLTISNAYGLSDLVINKVTIALPLPERGRLLGSGSINTATLKALTFTGLPVVSVPMNGTAVSDPVIFNPPLPSGQVLSITMYLSAGQASTVTTIHQYSRTSSASGKGDLTSAKTIPKSTGKTSVSWYFINSVEVYRDSSTRALVVVGDSLTDGRSSPLNQDMKWPSLLSNRVHATTGLQNISIVNEGSGGNNVLGPARGENVYQAGAVDRFDRDALSLDGIAWVMIFEGINDLGNSSPTQAGQDDIYTRLIQAYQDMISRTHAAGLPMIGATLTPFSCPPGFTGPANRYQLYPIREQTRQNLNDWTRNSGSFDYVVDFDAILRDPSNPAVTAPAYLGRDCLHPNSKGFQAMAAGFPLDVFSVQYTGTENSPVTIDGL